MKNIVFTRQHKHLLLWAVGAVVALAVFYIFAQLGIGIPCLFYRITGLLCPGCGNSRAALSLLRLDICAALRYNPLFFLEFFYILWVLFHCGKAYLREGTFRYQPPHLWLDVTLLVLFLLWGIVRNLL